MTTDANKPIASQELPSPTVSAVSIEPLVDATTVALYLNCSPGKVNSLARQGRIPYIQVGGRRKHRLSEIDEWMTAHRAGYTPTSSGR